MNLECELEFTKYLRRTKYLLTIYRTSQIQIPRNQKIFKLDQIKMNIRYSMKNWDQTIHKFLSVITIFWSTLYFTVFIHKYIIQMLLNKFRIYKILQWKRQTICLMLENLPKMRHYSSDLWMNISSKKWIVYQAKKFGIQSLFVSIWFKIDWIVHDRLNIKVTYL